MRKVMVAMLLISLATACFEYNPNQIILDDDEKNLTAKNIERLKAQPAPDTIVVSFMGDTQRFYDEADEYVDHLTGVDDVTFVLHGGDISDFGLAKEFGWVNDIMSDLKVPYLTAVGNHDLLANGKKVYNEMYGPQNYSFEYGNYKFIIIDTNSREYGFNGRVPDIDWLAAELSDNPADKRVIVVSHISPWNGDFDSDLEMDYANLLASDPHVVLSLHAHTHSFLDKVYYNDGVRYLVTTSMQKKGYLKLKLWDDGYSVEQVNY